MPRIFVQRVIDIIKSFLNSGFLAVFKQLFSVFNIPNYFDLIDLIDIFQNCLNFLDTDYKRFQFFEESNLYIKPISVTIGTSIDSTRQNNET